MRFEEFYNTYDPGDKEEPLDHAFLLSMFNQPVDEKFAEEHDVVDLIIEIMGTYERERKISEFYKFTQVLKTHNKHIFDDAFQYTHGLLIDHFCHRGQWEKVEELAEDFIQKPVETFDEMRRCFKKVVFYNDYADLIDRWVVATHEKVAKSPKLISGAGSDLAFAKYYIELEKVYHQYLDEKTFDWSEFKEKVNEVDFYPQEKHLASFEAALSDDLEDAKAVFEKKFPKDRPGGIEYLQKAFMKYMIDKNISFAISGELWSLLFNYWEPSDEEDEEPDIDDYFLIRPKAFYNFAGRQSGLIMDYRFLAAAILWGSTYAYDFLHVVKLISREQYEESLAMLQRMQRLFMMENYQSLWEYSYVHRWEAPGGKSEAVIAEEKAAFERSYELKRDEIPPLVSDEDPELKALRDEFVEKKESWMDRVLSRPVTPTQPVKTPKKYGRNEKVNVRYTDGSVKKNIKYKKVQKDIEAGKCEVIN